MGKGKRNRAEHALEALNKPAQKKKNVKKTTAPKWVAPVVTVAILVLIVGAIVLSSMQNSGSFLRGKTVLKSDHFTVNGAMFKYEMYYIYNDDLTGISSSDYYQQNASIFEQLGWSPATLLGIDTAKPLSTQKRGVTMFSGEDEIDAALTYADYTIATLKNVLTYCEAAKTAGIALTEDDRKTVDSTIALYQQLSDAYGYANLNAFFTSYFGSGIREKDIRNTLELTLLAGAYSDQLADGYIAEVSDEAAEEYYEKNYHDFILADLIGYTFQVSKTEEDAENKWAEAQAQIAELMECTDEKSFNAWMTAHEFKPTAAQNVIYSEDNEQSAELSKWLFGENSIEEAAAVGATKQLDGSDDNYNNVTVYMVTRAAHRDELPKRNVAYFVVENLTDTEAETWMDVFEDGTKNNTNFLALASSITAAAKTDGSDVKVLDKYNGNVENMEKGTIPCDEVNEFIYNAETEKGSAKCIKATAALEVDGETVEKEYSFFVFVGSDLVENVWMTSVKNTIANTKLGEWLKSNQENLKLTVNDKAISKI